MSDDLRERLAAAIEQRDRARAERDALNLEVARLELALEAECRMREAVEDVVRATVGARPLT